MSLKRKRINQVSFNDYFSFLTTVILVTNVFSAKKKKKQAAREEVSSEGERTIVEMSFNIPSTDRVTMGEQVMSQADWPWLVELGFVGDASGTGIQINILIFPISI